MCRAAWGPAPEQSSPLDDPTTGATIGRLVPCRRNDVARSVAETFDIERKAGRPRVYCPKCSPAGWQVVTVPGQSRVKLRRRPSLFSEAGQDQQGCVRQCRCGMSLREGWCVMAWSGSRGVNITAAGYGSKHQKLRRQLLPQAYGQPCSRCGLPMLPGQALHLDHDDYDHTKWRGFSHKACNLRAAAKKARAIQLGRWRVGARAAAKKARAIQLGRWRVGARSPKQLRRTDGDRVNIRPGFFYGASN